jgi:hypothetical protein
MDRKACLAARPSLPREAVAVPEVDLYSATCSNPFLSACGTTHLSDIIHDHRCSTVPEVNGCQGTVTWRDTIGSDRDLILSSNHAGLTFLTRLCVSIAIESDQLYALCTPTLVRLTVSQISNLMSCPSSRVTVCVRKAAPGNPNRSASFLTPVRGTL